MEAGFALINLINQDAFVFQFFPSEIKLSHRANWIPQQTTIGMKPVFYCSQEPFFLDFEELYLDNTDTGESLTPEIGKLRALMDEDEIRGTPPPLLAIWGDRRERCVIQDLTIDEVFFNDDGHPIRIKVKLALIRLQPDTEGTSVRVGN